MRIQFPQGSKLEVIIEIPNHSEHLTCANESGRAGIRSLEFHREFDVPSSDCSSHLIRRTRGAAVYSNRVAVVVEQPVNIKVPLGAYTSAVPAEVYCVPFE